MHMKPFRVGDHVKIIHSISYPQYIGQVGIIVERIGLSNVLKLQMSDNNCAFVLKRRVELLAVLEYEVI